MREIVRRLMDEGRESQGLEGASAAPEAAVALLHRRLHPVIGSGGFHALLRKAIQSLGGRYGDLGALADAGSLDELKAAVDALRSNGRDDQSRAEMMAEIMDAMLGTLEQMIGSDLTQRLVSRGAAAGGGTP